MIHLKQADCPPGLVRSLVAVREAFGQMTSCAWIHSKDAWQAILPDTPIKAPRFLFFSNDGTHRVPRPGDMSGSGPHLELMLAIDTIAKSFGDPDAVILRPNTCIVLQEKANIYFPMPDTSAHERLEDPAALEREFPGTFELR